MEQLDGDLRAIESVLKAVAHGGPWELWSSCPWLRVTDPEVHSVIEPCKGKDVHVNPNATKEKQGLVVSFDPVRLRRMVDAVALLMSEHACMRQQLEEFKAENDKAKGADSLTGISHRLNCAVLDQEPQILTSASSLRGEIHQPNLTEEVETPMKSFDFLGGTSQEMAVVQERRRCAGLLVMSDASLMLMAGEMTHQELGKMQSLLGNLRRSMLRR